MNSTPTVRKAQLVSTAGLLGHFQYVTLSHAWGEKPSFITLKENNEKDFEKRLPLAQPDFNKTFIEAMTMAGLLGYTYIWIDSLCIKQDSREDWEQEIPRMGVIYKNSDLTLSATGFAHGLHGMQSRSRRVLLPPRLKMHDNGEWLLISHDELSVDCPLQKRGWTLQESLLVRYITRPVKYIRHVDAFSYRHHVPFILHRKDSFGNAAVPSPMRYGTKEYQAPLNLTADHFTTDFLLHITLVPYTTGLSEKDFSHPVMTEIVWRIRQETVATIKLIPSRPLSFPRPHI